MSARERRTTTIFSESSDIPSFHIAPDRSIPGFFSLSLRADAPYLVGILQPYASRLGKIEGLADVLCVNLDKNELKTLNMPDPRVTVPDMLKRVKSRGDPEPHAAEMLAKDLDEIMKADQILWDHDERGGASGSGSCRSRSSRKSRPPDIQYQAITKG